MMRSTMLVVLLLCGGVPTLRGQSLDTRRHDCTSHESALTEKRETCRRADVPRASFRRAVPHYGKWLTVLSGAALIVFAEREHDRSRRDWNGLLDICRSAQDACARGSDGRYIRSDAEQLYQRSRSFDRRANRWLLGAQASLVATTALFIIDLHPRDGPGNIPYPPVKLGMRIPF